MTSRTSLSLFLVLPRPRQSRFDTHYLILQFLDYLRRQLRLKRNTLSVPMNVLRPRLTSQNMKRKKEISFTELTGSLITRKTINNYWARLSKISVASRSIICRSRKIIDLQDIGKSRYFVITEFNNCFIIRSPSLFSYFNHLEGKRSAIFLSKTLFLLRMGRLLFAEKHV